MSRAKMTAYSEVKEFTEPVKIGKSYEVLNRGGFNIHFIGSSAIFSNVITTIKVAHFYGAQCI